MCMSVLYRGQSFDSRRALRALIRDEPIWSAGSEPIPGKPDGEYCLCGVDHQRTAALLGCRVEDDGVDVFYLPVA